VYPVKTGEVCAGSTVDYNVADVAHHPSNHRKDLSVHGDRRRGHASARWHPQHHHQRPAGS
jgi:hypothetical protein